MEKMIQELFRVIGMLRSGYLGVIVQHQLQKFEGLKRAWEVNLQGVIAMETERNCGYIRVQTR